MVPPQPLPMTPQRAPTDAQVAIFAGQLLGSGAVGTWLQANGVSKPQDSVAPQAPQSKLLPQPSPSRPHCLPSQASLWTLGWQSEDRSVHLLAVTTLQP
jgi:hypothetical protein